MNKKIFCVDIDFNNHIKNINISEEKLKADKMSFAIFSLL